MSTSDQDSEDVKLWWSPLRALEWDPLSNYTIRSSNSFEWRKIIFGMITSMGIRHVKTLILRGKAFDETRAKVRLEQVNHPRSPSLSKLSRQDRERDGKFSRDTPCASLNVVLTQIRNEDLRTELEYFSEDYDEEREIEPRPGPTRETTPSLRPREGSKVGRNAEGSRPSEIETRENGNRGINLPPLLAAHLGRNESGQPLQSSLTSVYGGHQPTTNTGGISLLTAENGNPSAGGTSAYHSQGGIYRRPSRIMAYLHIMGLCSFADSAGSVTLFVRWIEDYPLPDGLKMSSHISSYDGKGDPDNFLHLFEWAIRMQKWLMPVACHMFTYTLKDSARIWWNSQKAGSILNYEDLKAKFRLHFSQQKKFTETHLSVHNIKQREGESTRAFAARYTDDTLQILGLHEDQCVSGFVYSLRTRSLVEHLSTNFPSTYKGLMEKTYTWIEAREVATNGAPSDRRENFERSKNLSKSPREILATEKLRSQIEEAVKSGQLSHLVKGIKKEQAKASKNQRVEGKKDKYTTPTKAPILMIRQGESYIRDNTSEDFISEGREITFPSVTRGSNSSAPVIIKAKIFGREVGRVHMDSGSSCEVIYEHCFMKLKPSIRASKIDSKVPLIGFLREKSWSSEEIPLEITIGNPLSQGGETLNFVIVRSDSPYNMLLGRTVMQKMGIIVSTIHGAIKFHTAKGIGTVFSTYGSDKIKEGMKKVKEMPPASKKGVFSYTKAEEKVVINDKYPEQTVTIRKQLTKHFKQRLRGLLRSNADVFAWTHTDMTGIPRTILIEGKPFKTGHKLNEYSHIKPIKQKRQGLGPDRNTAASSPQTDDIVKEIRAGSCGFNAEPRSMVFRIIKQGYYWPSMHKDAAKVIQDCEKCKEQSAIRKAAKNGAITTGNGWPFSHWGVNILGPLPTTLGGLKFLAIAIWSTTSNQLERRKNFREGIFADLCKGLKVTQSFSPVIEHMEIMNHIEKQLTRTENAVAKDDRGRTKEVTKRKESKEVASIEEAHYQNKLRRYHNERINQSTYKIGDFILLSQNDAGNPHLWQGPHMISEVREGELYKIIVASDHSLIQTTKGESLRKFYM
ncbi:reverse transcriptase domain-containing protein [Tanacetum coccineum]